MFFGGRESEEGGGGRRGLGASELREQRRSRLKLFSSIAAAAAAFAKPIIASPIPAVFRDFVSAAHVLAGVDTPLGPAGDGPGRGRREAGQGGAHERKRDFFALFFFGRVNFGALSIFSFGLALAFSCFRGSFFSFLLFRESLLCFSLVLLNQRCSIPPSWPPAAVSLAARSARRAEQWPQQQQLQHQHQHQHH